MKILVTSGGTREHIDEVRVLTNISTGKLGAQIANTFYLNHNIEKIYYVCSKGSAIPSVCNLHTLVEDNEKNMVEVIYADSTQDVYDIMERLVPKVDVVIHSMAISDFGFKPSNIKLKSNDPHAFIDSLRDRIVVNPKIISFIKKWNHTVRLVGFKFEVNKTHEELIDIAYESLVRNNCDLVVANDKQEMKENNEHIAYIVGKGKTSSKCVGKLGIAMNLATLLLP